MPPVTRGFHRQRAEADPARVPPGQYVTTDFPVLSAGPTPHTPHAEWSLTLDGAVDRARRWSWDELLGLPSEAFTVDIHCVTKWSKLDTTWTGVRVKDLLERAGGKPTGTHVMAHCDGGYTTNIPVEALYDEDVLVAHTYDGKPLEPDHGAPL